MPLYINPLTFSGTLTNRPGPKTPQGRAVAARNATTHGLFARDVVLPALGEDPAAFETLSATLDLQLAPGNLLERHYVEAIAAASWRLRRLHRWQAQLFEDETLTEDERLDKLDQVLRHETALHRQIDKAVKMLARDVPQLFEGRARKKALADLRRDRARLPRRAGPGGRALPAHPRVPRAPRPCPPAFDLNTLDNTHPVPERPPRRRRPRPQRKTAKTNPTRTGRTSRRRTRRRTRLPPAAPSLLPQDRGQGGHSRLPSPPGRGRGWVGPWGHPPRPKLPKRTHPSTSPSSSPLPSEGEGPGVRGLSEAGGLLLPHSGGPGGRLPHYWGPGVFCGTTISVRDLAG